MTYWLRIDRVLWGDTRSQKGGFESIEELNRVVAKYGYSPLYTGSKVYVLRVSGVVLGTAELVELPPVKDISKIPRK